MSVDVLKIARQIADGRNLTKEDDISFLEKSPLEDVLAGADFLRQTFVGQKVDLCSIINAKSGRCGENCKFCAQSGQNHTGCDEYSFLKDDIVFEQARKNEQAGINRFAIVTAGRALCGNDFESALNVLSKMKRELKINLCASMGFLSQEQFKRLREVGVTRYHCNIETSRRYFPSICTTHTFEMKIQTIQNAQKEGLFVCSGGIIGLGETFFDRIDMAFTLADLGVRSIPINALLSIKGTPFENLKPLGVDEILRSVAVFRFINPRAQIRLAAGRAILGENWKKAFEGGASAMITGDMLTTTGGSVKSDIEILKSLGREFELNS